MQTRLFFKNFPYQLSETEIGDLFALAGEVVDLCLLKGKQSHTFNGMGFVTLRDEAAAEAAILLLNQEVLEGRQVVVELAVDDPRRVLVDKIVTTLGETEEVPRQQIKRIVRTCGVEFAEQMLAETLRVEAEGGLMLPDQSRRRTPGGVFFYLVRGRLSPDQARQIFLESRKWHQRQRLSAGQASPASTETLAVEAPAPLAEPEPVTEADTPPEPEIALARLQAELQAAQTHLAEIQARPDRAGMFAAAQQVFKLELAVRELLKANPGLPRQEG